MIIRCTYAQLVSIKELKKKFHPKNRNKHPKDQLERLAKILEYQGARYCAKISKQTDYVTSGHGRILAAEIAGWDQYPVDYQDYDNEDQELADLTADNAIASWSELDFSGINEDLADLGPDFDIDLLGIKNFVIEPAEKFVPGSDEDEVPEPPKEPKTRKGDIYELGRHRLLCGDATMIDDVSKLMEDRKADMVWTDPPYNVDYEGKTKDALKIQNDSMTSDTFYQFLFDSYSNMLMHTKPGGAIYVSHADTEGMNFRKALLDAGWLLKQCLIWVKQTLVMGRQDYHWKHEPILYGWVPGAAHSWFNDRKQTTVLAFNRPSRSADHPTTKPVELIEYCLGNSCPPQGLVLDLFGGSGSTLIACEKTNRRAALLELDPRYCDVVVSRWEKYAGKEAKLLSKEPDQGSVAKAKGRQKVPGKKKSGKI